MIIAVLIEIPKYGRYKYHYRNGDFKRGYKLVRPQPENYGHIIGTLAPDNEPLDVIVLTNRPLRQGIVKARVIGAITRRDKDDKIIAVPVKSKLKTIDKVPEKIMKKLLNTFTGPRGPRLLKKIVGPKDAATIVNRSKRIQAFS